MINIYKRSVYKFSIILLIFFSLFFNHSALSSDDNKKITILGNENIDEEIILSIINDKITDYSISNLNEIIKTLYNTGNFKNIETEFLEDEIIIKIIENPSIEKISFDGNKRFKKENIFEIFDKKKYFQTFNEFKIDNFISDLKGLYSSYGYNLIQIEYEIVKYEDNDRIVDLVFNLNEGSISKINRIYFRGNKYFSNNQLRSNIKTKQRNYLRPFTNINYKVYQIVEDKRKLINFYKKSGFKDVTIDTQSEYITKKNTLNLYFYINEGTKYNFRNFDFNLINLDIKFLNVEDLIKNEKNIISKILLKNNSYNPDIIEESKNRIRKILNDNGFDFFAFNVIENFEDSNIDIIIESNKIEPEYVNQINIYGNTRTKDNVIRREIPFVEGDPFTKNNIRETKIKLDKLGYFKKVDISPKKINNLIDIDINVDEKSTGEFNVGVAFNSFDGATFITGLKEKNILGDGRELDVSINTSSDNTIYSFGIVEPYIFNRDIDFIYNISYSDRNLSNSSSYELTQFKNNVGLRYALTDKIKHTIILQYALKNYNITKTSAPSSIKKLSGDNADISINNTINYNDLDSFIRPTTGSSIIYYNIFSPATNSDNGYIKNVFTYSKYNSFKGNVFSFRSKVGSVYSIQNKEIPVDDKFVLGGRWLRGFDSRGVGPRESRTSYIGGKNLITAKFDIQRPIFKNSDNPIDFNLFTDIGTLFDNQVDPESSKESIRASYGFGFKLYSVIGPVGFSWAYPILDEDYDIKRMFMFSIGNLN